jgi:hypothetical protein
MVSSTEKNFLCSISLFVHDYLNIPLTRQRVLSMYLSQSGLPYINVSCSMTPNVAESFHTSA